jgi:type I restriction enzyme S subunit
LYRKATSDDSDDKVTIRVSDYCKVFTGKKDVNQAVENGKNRFYSCSPTPARSNDAIYEGKAILVAGNGSYTGRTTYVDEAFDLYQRTYALTPFETECPELFLIYAALQTDFQEQIESKLHGSAIPYIVYGDLADFSFDIVSNYSTLASYIETLVYKSLKNILEIEQLSNLAGLMLSSISSLYAKGA